MPDDAIGLAESEVDRIRRIASRHGLLQVQLFGSRARRHSRTDSDGDLLVDLAPGRGNGARPVHAIQILGGRGPGRRHVGGADDHPPRRHLPLERQLELLGARVRDAVLRNLEVLGEAAKNVPDEFRARHPEIEWSRIAGLRDVLIHRYFGIDYATVWDTVAQRVPALRRQVEALLVDCTE